MKDIIVSTLELLLGCGLFMFILWDLPINNKWEISLLLSLFYRELIDINRNLKNKL